MYYLKYETASHYIINETLLRCSVLLHTAIRGMHACVHHEGAVSLRHRLCPALFATSLRYICPLSLPNFAPTALTRGNTMPQHHSRHGTTTLRSLLWRLRSLCQIVQRRRPSASRVVRRPEPVPASHSRPRRHRNRLAKSRNPPITHGANIRCGYPDRIRVPRSSERISSPNRQVQTAPAKDGWISSA